MTGTLGTTNLRGGDEMTIKLVECPAEEYLEPLLHLVG